ncbi:MAG: phosphate acyltransferase PlsX [Alphaproteobacteria bacterium]|nr:phosphate acyltransferase PlsX [Alphaproteobacteria bacterium]
MPAPITIALDAMGGDKAPALVLRGAEIARVRFPDVHFILFGDEAKLRPLIAKRRRLKDRCEVRHAESLIGATDRPAQALRRGGQSSMRRAIDAVAEGEAGGVVSAGNTGALMAMAKHVLKTVRGIHRPAIASFFPTLRGESTMLDLGANIECDADNLVEFAVMGAAFAHTALGIQRPTVGLLNVGVEEVKGNDAVKQAAQILRRANLSFDFYGFVEGNDIAAGTVDVIVTDGFTGNVALKAAEGTAQLYTSFLRAAFRRSWLSKLGYVLARPALKALREQVDPRVYNGAMFVGLNGVVVKSHGGTDAKGFASAIGVAVDMIRGRYSDLIVAECERFNAANQPLPQAAAS